MRKLSKEQFKIMDAWMQKNARPFDRAKWNYIFNNGTKEEMLCEMLKYQNPDGGMGNGFEPDTVCPMSTALSTAEAIFQAYEYGLDCNADWFKRILEYFENSVQNIPKYWEDYPKESMDYPHSPWASYSENTVFNPNPCGVVASALILYGTKTQKELGYKIAKDCFDLLVGADFCGDHDTLNMQALVEQLYKAKSPLVTDEIILSLKRRILENTCFDKNKWNEYYFNPLDYVFSPDSLWLDVVKMGIDNAIDFYIDTINDQGVWTPNFSWGVDTDISKQVTENWKGYITVKRAKTLLNFGRIEL
ncbi:MAG: hypothetical protein IJF26_03440 [Clostridia bacterium]|nr:hypothetical protein [Clostridia bacterium]